MSLSAFDIWLKLSATVTFLPFNPFPALKYSMNSFLPMCRSLFWKDFNNICNKHFIKTTWESPLLLNSYVIFNMRPVNNRNMAGHSKWQNVKHTKEAKDLEKSRTISRFTMQIKKIALEGGTNPKVNSKLASAITLAKENNVPMATIDNVLKRMENRKLKAGTSEILGPSGSFFILNLESETLSKTIHDLKTICRKVQGFRLAPEGRAKVVFDLKGVIRVMEKRDGTTITSEKALDDAILAGAEEVSETKDEDKIIFEFITSAEDMLKVKKEVEIMNYEIHEFGLEYLAKQKVNLSEDDMNELGKFYELLEEYQDVQKIFDNVE